MLMLEICGNSSTLNAILFVKTLINIAFVVCPLIVSLLLTIDLAKSVFAKDEQENQKNVKLGIKRILYAVILMFVPLLVETFMGMISGYSKVANCYDIATEAKVKELRDKEEIEYKKKQEEKEKERQKTASEVAAEKTEAQKAAAEAAKRAIENLNKNAGDGDTTLDLSGVSSGAEKIALTAEKLAWPAGTKESVWHHHYYYNRDWHNWSELTEAKPTKAFMDAYDKVKPGHFKISRDSKWGTKHSRIGASCDKFAGTVVRYSGYDKSFPDALGSSQNSRLANTKNWTKVSSSNAKRGAVCIKKSGTHILIYLGGGKVAHAGYGGVGKNEGRFGRIQKFSLSGYNCWNAKN